jgi:hypothetical protein
MNLPDRHHTSEAGNRRRDVTCGLKLVVVWVAFLGVWWLWGCHAVYGSSQIDGIETAAMPVRATRIGSAENISSTLTILHTNDTLGYVEPCG